MEYCCKEDTRTGKVFTYNCKIPQPIRKPRIISELKEWQQELKEILDTVPDERAFTGTGILLEEQEKQLC